MTERGEPKLRLAGMALANGLLVHGPTHWAAAARTPDGVIAVASGRKPRARGALLRVPGVRGLLRLAEGLVVVPIARRRLREARLPFESGLFLVSIAASSIGAGVARRSFAMSAATELGVAAASLLPAVVAVRMSDLAAYHGAEHKAIGAYERGLADAAHGTREHERCGSNLVAPMMIASLLANAALVRLSGRRDRAAHACASLAGAGAAIEVFLWAERHPQRRLARAIRRPGMELQSRLVTREPTEEQLDVARAALDEILRVEPPPGAEAEGPEQEAAA